MSNDQHVRGRRLLRQVHDVGDPAGLLERANDSDRLVRDRFLRLIRRRTDVVRAVDAVVAREHVREIGRRP